MNETKEKIMHGVFLLAAVTSIISLILIVVFIFTGGLPMMLDYGVFDFIFGTTWNQTTFGILPMIVGSILVTIGAIVLGVPIGVSTAIFMAEFCPPKLYSFLKPAVNLMAGIPSIVYGFFALRIIVPWIRNSFGGPGNSMLAAILLLGVMILPTIIALSESAIRSVPRSYYSGSIALGATQERSIFNVLVPAAKSGIFSSVVLGVGRAIGETMAVVMVAGNQPIMPRGLTQGVRTLTTNIVLEMAYASGQHREALIATGVVLFVFIMIINTTFLIVKSRGGES
ncbi:phosphate ABC transporter membrane protein 1, PhoT family (TC 3.A.1.7.1) [Alkalibacterium subtropicum]|uniref:Phosphate transport system permease protein n=1 Tax=Alkalibacterium subtropicum TaxID=753702 RepID=A0A1I1LQ09_9LACT|nr:phosphate ABC transporter permease subunit PstC [Alkalibacterium subtropicum]SFC75317.1 phosphate ABC transporter membrane protein 1, PhoT family (TC 3.A.1.7.1) [Alkalibacterium subtropicum]